MATNQGQDNEVTNNRASGSNSRSTNEVISRSWIKTLIDRWNFSVIKNIKTAKETQGDEFGWVMQQKSPRHMSKVETLRISKNVLQVAVASSSQNF